MMSAFGIFYGTAEGYIFTGVWSNVMSDMSVRLVTCLLCCFPSLTSPHLDQVIYPTIIIILVSKFMSQENAILSGKADEDSPSWSSRLERTVQNGALSTIRFDDPQQLTASSTTREDRDCEIGKKEGDPAIV